MKKLILALAIITISLNSCRKDSTTTTETVDITTQNTYDDAAILKYLDSNYLDAKGNIKAFSDSDTTDDNYPKLSSYNPVTLPSGVVYIVIPNKQPASGKTILWDDALNIMQNTITYVATKDSNTNVVSFTSGYTFRNQISSTGVPEYDPAYYYVKKSVLDKYNTDHSTNYDRSFFQIEGLREGLANFQAFSMANSENYNLQGIIIVPSRAAFARDLAYPYSNYAFTDRSFVFNFQIYSTTARSVAGD